MGLKMLFQKKLGKTVTKKLKDNFEEKALPAIYKKETLSTQEIKGQVHIEIVRTSIINEVIEIKVKLEIVVKNILRESIIY